MSFAHSLWCHCYEATWTSLFTCIDLRNQFLSLWVKVNRLSDAQVFIFHTVTVSRSEVCVITYKWQTTQVFKNISSHFLFVVEMLPFVALSQFIIIIKNECHSNIMVDRLQGCGHRKKLRESESESRSSKVVWQAQSFVSCKNARTVQFLGGVEKCPVTQKTALFY